MNDEVIIFLIQVFASETGWKYSVKEVVCTETEKSFIIKPENSSFYSSKRIPKSSVGVIDSNTTDSTRRCSRYVYITDETLIAQYLNKILDEIIKVFATMQSQVNKSLSFAPKNNEEIKNVSIIRHSNQKPIIDQNIILESL